MKIDALGIQAFVAILEQGTFQKAAKSLFISQAALSKRLKNLEEHLGLILIERTTRSWTLSAAGRSFLPRAQRFISEVDYAIREIQDERKGFFGQVTIACRTSVIPHFLPSAFDAFSKRYPRVQIRSLDRLSPNIADAVLAGVADFGIDVLPRDVRGLEVSSLVKDRFVFFCRADHPLSKRKSLHWGDIEGQTLVRVGKSAGSGLLLDTILQESQLEMPALYEVQNPSTALSLVAAGVGVAILPRLFLAPESYPRIRCVPLTAPTVVRTLALLRRKGHAISPHAEALHSIVKKMMRG